ncbi:MAG: YraN family protein [Caldisericaceae bacterium]
MKTNKNSLGKWGEDIAVKYLASLGMKTIGRNIRTPFGEIDVVCKDRKKLYFVEVKTRTSEKFGLPLEAITGLKKEHMANSALYYLKGEAVDFEIGVVTILKGESDYKIEYIKDIF